jgi:hydroxymethylglutaryl-CoA reductase (NADPH)
MLQEGEARERIPVPRSDDGDYTKEMAAKRREFVRAQTGIDLSHVAHSSVSPSLVSGNIENFIGVAQVPMGLAGPIRVSGEHAEGDY